MTDREKLIEVLTDDNCPLLYMQGDVGGLADYLIANGVTIQNWIPVTERLPGIGELVFVCAGDHMDSNYLESSDEWGFGFEHRITHWMPLPEPPKEVDHG